MNIDKDIFSFASPERVADLLKVVTYFKKELGCNFDAKTSGIHYAKGSVFYWDECIKNGLSISIDLNHLLCIYVESPSNNITIDLCDFNTEKHLWDFLDEHYPDLHDDDIEFFNKFKDKDFELYNKMQYYLFEIK